MRNRLFIIVTTLTISAFLPFRAHAYGRSFDGGELKGMDTMCTCSGGETIKINSYVDSSQHVYLYELGATELYANYNITSSNGYFLTTLAPFAECLVYEGEDCNQEGQTPEGTFEMVGTSFNDSRNSLMSLLEKFPMVSNITEAFSKSISLSSWNRSDSQI